MAVPYFAAFYVTRAFLPEMLRRDTGHIVNVSSAGSRLVWPGATAYLAARWAVRGFTEALRADLAGTRIGVTLFEGGVVRSPYWEHNPGSRERVPRMGKLVPEISTEEAAGAIVRGIARERRLVVVPFMLKLFYWQHAVLPGVVQWLLTHTGYQRSPASSLPPRKEGDAWSKRIEAMRCLESRHGTWQFRRTAPRAIIGAGAMEVRMTLSVLLKKPSAFAPVVMSLAAVSLIAATVAGVVPVPPVVTGTHRDEAAPARLFQILMLLQLPIIAVFAARWLPRAPRPALLVLLWQLAAAAIPIATIIWLER
jgi:hypothetical protein